MAFSVSPTLSLCLRMRDNLVFFTMAASRLFCFHLPLYLMLLFAPFHSISRPLAKACARVLSLFVYTGLLFLFFQPFALVLMPCLPIILVYLHT